MENCNGTLVVAGGFDFYSDEPSRGSLSSLLLKPGATEWAEGPRMAEAKSFYSSLEIDGCMYALGPRIERFDPTVGKWQVVMRDDSLQRSHFAAAMANGRVLMIGRQVHEYDPVAGTCTLVEAWPGKFEHDHFHCVATVGETVHVIGGLRGPQVAPSNQHWIRSNGIWTRLPDAPEAVFAKFGVVEAVGDTIYIFSMDKGWAYNCTTTEWRPLAPLPLMLAMPASLVRNGTIEVVGGQPPDPHARVRLVYDIGADAWATVGAAPAPADNAARPATAAEAAPATVPVA